MPIRVYLADLRHDYSGILANDCMPLGIAYMKAVMDFEDTAREFKSRLVVYPERLLELLKTEPPNVLMLTNYVWNESLALHFVNIAKQIDPNILTVMGGPNISLEPKRQAEYLKKNDNLDIYVLGEGDFLAYSIVHAFLDAGLSIPRLGAMGIPSATYRNADGEVAINSSKPRYKQLEDIPSPWLTGIQDEFFDGRLAPMIETNRGCPFACTFCVQGTGFYSKINNFPLERIKEEILYIARRIKEHSPNVGTLRIADSNYGMFERDIEISSMLGQMQRDYGWPTYIDATTGKNRPERIIKSVEKVSGALVLWQAVQSLDDDVLRNVKRQTIKLDAYKALEIYMRGRGLKSNSDLILGLPGESLSSHLRGLYTLLDSNIHHMNNFQAMMLKGSEMETLESRAMFKFETRFRVLPKNFGIYASEKVFDVEEIVVATDSLPFNDYLAARKWHLVTSVFWNGGWFEHITRFMRTHGIKNSEWWARLLPAMENSTAVMRAFLDDFERETTGELFPTSEECVNFYSQPQNFKKLQDGEIGDNLMYRYRAMASFHLWPEVCKTAMEVTRQLLQEHGIAETIADFDIFWQDLETYTRLLHAWGEKKEAILSGARAKLHYDFDAWLQQPQPRDPNRYRLPEAVEFQFTLRADARHELERALETWTTEIKGLSKMITRIKPGCQRRQCLRAAREVEMVA